MRANDRLYRASTKWVGGECEAKFLWERSNSRIYVPFSNLRSHPELFYDRFCTTCTNFHALKATIIFFAVQFFFYTSHSLSIYFSSLRKPSSIFSHHSEPLINLFSYYWRSLIFTLHFDHLTFSLRCYSHESTSFYGRTHCPRWSGVAFYIKTSHFDFRFFAGRHLDFSQQYKVQEKSLFEDQVKDHISYFSSRCQVQLTLSWIH